MASPQAGSPQATVISEWCCEALVWEVLPGVSPRGFLSGRGESTEEGGSQLGVLCCFTGSRVQDGSATGFLWQVKGVDLLEKDVLGHTVPLPLP